MLESQHDLSRVKPGPYLVKLSRKCHVLEEFTTINELHHHVQIICVLEGVLKLHDKGMLDSLHDLALGLYALLLIRAIHLLFLDNLHGEVFQGLLVLDEVNFTVGAMTDHFQKAEVLLASRILRPSIIRRLLSLNTNPTDAFVVIVPLDSSADWDIPCVDVGVCRVAL